MKYSLLSSTTKVALQHMSKKILYQLIKKLGSSFSNRIDTPDTNIDSIMRYYAVGAFNHVEIIEKTIRDYFNENELKTFEGILPIKKDITIPPNVTLRTGYYFIWISKRKWELFTCEGITTSIFIIGRSCQLEKKLLQNSKLIPNIKTNTYL